MIISALCVCLSISKIEIQNKQMKIVAFLIVVILQSQFTVAVDTTGLATCSNNCSPGCLSCFNSTCSSCRKGYTLQNMTCINNFCSIPDCLLCDSSNSCIQCTDPYAVFDSQAHTCVQKCSLPNCSKCKAGSSYCETCASGYALYGWDRSCILSSIANCIKVHDWKGSQFLCSQCLQGYIPSKDKMECLIIGCSTIQDCHQCVNSSVCSSCRAGFTLSGNSCVRNPCNYTNCMACNEQGSCIRSASSHYLLSARLIAKSCSISNCLVCKPGSIFCDSCQAGFQYNIWTKQCDFTNQNSNSSSSNLKYLWFLLIVAGIVAVLIIIKVTRQRQEEQRLQAENQKAIEKRQLPYIENPPMLHVIKNSPFVEPCEEVSSEDCPSNKIKSRLPPLKVPTMKKSTASGSENNMLSRVQTFRSELGIERSEVEIKVPSIAVNQNKGAQQLITAKGRK